MSEGGRTVWAERFRTMEKSPTKEPTTIGQAVETFLAAQHVRVGARAISAGYYDLLRRSLNHFADTIGGAWESVASRD